MLTPGTPPGFNVASNGTPIVPQFGKVPESVPPPTQLVVHAPSWKYGVEQVAPPPVPPNETSTALPSTLVVVPLHLKLVAVTLATTLSGSQVDTSNGVSIR
jgi:hypothetical protein